MPDANTPNYADPTLNRFFESPLSETDPELYAAERAELARQQDKIELIASENIVSRAVLEAQGGIMTNKYAEGYPGRRYYGGCDRARQEAVQLWFRQRAAPFRRAGQRRRHAGPDQAR